MSAELDMVNNVYLDLDKRKRKQSCLIVFGLRRNNGTDDLKQVKDIFKYLMFDEWKIKSRQRF